MWSYTTIRVLRGKPTTEIDEPQWRPLLFVEPRLIVDFRERLPRASGPLTSPHACSWQCDSVLPRVRRKTLIACLGLNTNRLASQPVRPALFSAGSVDQCVEGGPLYMFVFQHRPERP
jgi:hypothetical protein